MTWRMTHQPKSIKSKSLSVSSDSRPSPVPTIGQESTKQIAKPTVLKVAMTKSKSIQTTELMKVSVSVHVHVMFSPFPGWKLVSFLVMWGMPKMPYFGPCSGQEIDVMPLGSLRAFD